MPKGRTPPHESLCSMNLQPTLESELVFIRPLMESDRNALCEAANDPLIWEQHPCKRNEPEEFAKFFKESMEPGGALAILDSSSGKIIGSSRFKLIPKFFNGVEIGWTFLSRDYWGGRYNGDVKGLMIGNAFHFVDHVVLFVAENNIRSQKAAEKIGGRKIDESEYPELLKNLSERCVYIIEKPQSKGR